ncbi:VOC family protein [Sphingomonas sp. DG1-23]|uniref:bleomycin resistance protein n=1 Tax=Sphingomonas sp. DG1-23 TaxID=3068316 RepID=UPI00273D3524|nr:VOC family protein [Sphingomonas sp. DG1-23]MDP5278871.1 VOC family protein [Sphingomonas sp. DG1-23]
MELHYRGMTGPDIVEAGEAPVSNMYRITPFMHVPDLEAAVAFFTGILGFECRFRQGIYAYVQREAAAFRLVENVGDEGAPPGNRRFCYYVDVNDVDAVAAELAPKAKLLNDGDLYGPIDQLYGQRELMVMAPDGNLLVFGQDLTRD